MTLLYPSLRPTENGKFEQIGQFNGVLMNDVETLMENTFVGPHTNKSFPYIGYGMCTVTAHNMTLGPHNTAHEDRTTL